MASDFKQRCQETVAASTSANALAVLSPCLIAASAVLTSSGRTLAAKITFATAWVSRSQDMDVTDIQDERQRFVYLTCIALVVAGGLVAQLGATSAIRSRSWSRTQLGENHVLAAWRVWGGAFCGL